MARKYHPPEGLDLLDRKILFVLNVNARFSINTISKVCNVSRDVVKYRMERMKKDGVILFFSQFIIEHNVGLHGGLVLMSLKAITMKKENEIFEYLCKHKNISYLEKVVGFYRISFKIWASSIGKIQNIIGEISKNLGHLIVDLEVLYTIKGFDHSFGFFLDKENGGEILKKLQNIRDGSAFYKELGQINKKPSKPLDINDLKIMDELGKDCRQSILSISRKLEIPYTTVFNKIKRICGENFIGRFWIYSSHEKMGFQDFNLLIKTALSSDKEIKKFYNFLDQIPYISYSQRLFGEFDWCSEIYAKNGEHYEEIISEIVEFLGENIIKHVTLKMEKVYKDEFFYSREFVEN